MKNILENDHAESGSVTFRAALLIDGTIKIVVPLLYVWPIQYFITLHHIFISTAECSFSRLTFVKMKKKTGCFLVV